MDRRDSADAGSEIAYKRERVLCNGQRSSMAGDSYPFAIIARCRCVIESVHALVEELNPWVLLLA
jgi:hypothetical protein